MPKEFTLPKKNYLIYSWSSVRRHYSGLEWIWELWLKGRPVSAKLQSSRTAAPSLVEVESHAQDSRLFNVMT